MGKKMFHKNKFFLIFLSLFAWMAFSLVSICESEAVNRNTMSTDELLEYTLTDLRVKMKQVVISNKQIAEKIQALRKRIFFLKQEVRDYENEKIGLLEESLELTDVLKLSSKERSIVEKKLEDVKDHLRDTKNEILNFKKTIESNKEKEDILQKTISLEEQEFIQLKQSFKGEDLSSAKKIYEREKDQYRISIKESQKEIDQKQKEIDVLKRRLVRSIDGRNKEWEIKRLLEKELVFAKESIVAEQKRKESLIREGETLKKKRQQLINKEKEDISQLALYQEILEGCIDDFYNLKQTIRLEFDTHQKEMSAFKRSLMAESKLLMKQESCTLKSLEVVKKQKENAQKKMALMSSLAEVDEKTDGVDKEKDKIRLQIANREERLRTLLKKEDEVKRQIKELEKDVSIATQKTARYKRKGEADQKRDIEGDYERSQRKIQDLNRSIDDLEGLIAGWKEELKMQRQENNVLSKRIVKGNRDIETLKKEREEVKLKALMKDDTNKVIVEKIKDEINALKLQKEMLANSLLVIESQYDAEELAADEFIKEEQQLKDYFALLKEENLSLKVKMEGLSEVLEDLRKRSGSSK